MRTFLLINGYNLSANEEQKYATMIAVASGNMTEIELADWLEQHCVPLD